MKSLHGTAVRGLITLLVVGALTGCGGGSSPSEGARAFVAGVAQQEASAPRKLALALNGPVDAKAMLDWIEFKFPSLFPRGPASFQLVNDGKTYTVRAYGHAAGTRYAGITTDGEVWGLGDFTNNVLQRFGVLADFAAQINADSCNVYPGSCPAAVAGLPAELLSQPAHPNCAAARSGPYRWLNPADSDPAWNTYVAQMDAPTGRITFADGSTDTATSTGNCTFSAHGGRTRMVVSPAGVIVSTSLNQNNQQVIQVGIPAQAVTLDAFTGLGNWISYESFSAGPQTRRWRTAFGTAEFDAAGRMISLSDCEARSACVAKSGPFGALTVNPAGGFDLVEPSNGRVMRIFAYRPASGDLTWFGVQDGQLIVGTPQKSLPLPAVGDSLPVWTLESNWTGNAGTSFSDTSGAVTAVDANARTYTRTLASGRVDVWNLDSPRFGLRYRVGSATSSELLNMPLPGMGMTVYGAVVDNNALSTGFFGIGVSK